MVPNGRAAHPIGFETKKHSTCWGLRVLQSNAGSKGAQLRTNREQLLRWVAGDVVFFTEDEAERKLAARTDKEQIGFALCSA